jgi:beta-barrel assembly-enhancing protease
MDFNRRAFMQVAGRLAWLSMGITPLAGLVSGCKSLETAVNVGAGLGVDAGLLSDSQAISIQKSCKAVARSFEDFSPEQEYYVGRTVGTLILKKYPPYHDETATHYINTLGQILARASDRPETYAGYHFMIQDSSDINALAAPGGLIFVTRGLLRCCLHEAAVAAVLAHEIGHVQYKHGLQAIKKSRVTSALTTLGVEGTKAFGGKELAQLTETFEKSISDITNTLINNGYSRGFESKADQAAVTILKRVGYDPNGLTEMLGVMGKRLKPGRIDFAKTHPSPHTRIADIHKLVGNIAPVRIPEERQRRFQKALAKI